MATRTRKKSSQPHRLPFLPESTQIFLARRIVDLASLICALLGTALIVSIVSYNPADPSLNTAVTPDEAHRIANWLGTAGSYTADISLQTLGLGALAFGITVLAWGIRIFLRQSLRPFLARTVALLAAPVLLGSAAAHIPSGQWMDHPYLGGAGGTLILDKAASLIHPLTGEYAHLSTAILAAICGLALLNYACAIRKEEWTRALRRIWQTTRFLVLTMFATIRFFYNWVRHYGDKNHTPAFSMPRLSFSFLRRAGKAGGDVPVSTNRQKPAAQMPPKAPAAPDTDKMPTYRTQDEGDEKEHSSIKVFAPAKSPTRNTAGGQSKMSLGDQSEWDLPDINLLQDIPADAGQNELDEKVLRRNAEMLQNVLADFNVKGEIVAIHPGPVVTLYELEPAPGTKTARVIGLADDIARSMSATSVRAAVVPGRNVIGIELPNQKRQTVYMREILETKSYQKTSTKLPLVLGKDIGGEPVIADLSRMPHLLVAGTTGSGKSVAINTMLLSLLYRLPPEKCRFIMIDPKMLELSVYDDIPHLLSPVVTEPGKAVVALKWAVQEMEERYRAMSKLGVRNIEGYNARLREARKKGETLMRKVQTGFDPDTGKPVYENQPLDLNELPYIVIVVDEFADLMLVAGKDVEAAIQRLAQMARAAGIHLIMATQRPSVDVITGVIKANFPTRISFSVTSKIDSRTILGEAGAEQLLGMGDMLYMASGGRIKRVHGPFVSDEDVENVVNHLRAQGEPAYLDEVTEGSGSEGSEVVQALFGEGEEGDGDSDELYDRAVAIVASERKASTSFIQRHLQIGYNRAARIIEEMEKQGVIGPANHVGKREILIGDYSGA